MKTAYMIHEVVMKGERVAPHTVVSDLSDETFAELEALGAVREATEDEALLAAPAAAAAATEPVVDPKAAKKAAAAAAKKAADEAAAAKAAEEAAAAEAAAKKDADPDVTDNDLLGNT